ncbi:hypothetical protein [Pseudomonas sp. CFBP 13602]|uniref:hypothetical protein n=1 Tax=Pseudomonas sp. CFBP 13602 TaxID=2774039 RepID=UPI0017811416|nr:hypothetical protein [Pseudomonas sp. CFBP 13602]MBD8826715.1 hypothetical protein [Pseudomonas sp. CFBP 13602]
MKHSTISQSAFAFSDALRKRAPDDFAFELLTTFPTACCKYASLLLAWFLVEEQPGIQVELVTGELVTERQSRHVWLSIDGLNVDITTDQFDVRLPCVLITSLGEWHARYDIVHREIFDKNFYLAYEEVGQLQLIADNQFLSQQARASLDIFDPKS